MSDQEPTHPRVVIVTTAHDPRDGRLTRHALSLRAAGCSVDVVRTVSGSRWKRFLLGPFTTFGAIVGADVAIFPDPELFVMGPIAARLRGVRPIIDVHEDYRLVARNRSWVPIGGAGLFGLLADVHRRLGTRLAAATMVVSADLARTGEAIVGNQPNPEWLPSSASRTTRGVYVGDVTISRGIRRIVELVDAVPGLEVDLVGPMSAEARRIVAAADGAERIRVYGRRPYLESWEIARTALFGISLLEDTRAYRRAVPSKVWEYMTSGLAVLASDLPAQSTVVHDAGCGAVVRPGEAAEVVARWLDDPTDAVALGAAGRNWIATRPWSDQALCDAVLGSSTP